MQLHSRGTKNKKTTPQKRVTSTSKSPLSRPTTTQKRRISTITRNITKETTLDTIYTTNPSTLTTTQLNCSKSSISTHNYSKSTSRISTRLFGSRSNTGIYDPHNPSAFDSKTAQWMPSSYTTQDASLIAPSNALKLRRDLVLADKNDAKNYSSKYGDYHDHLQQVDKLINRARINGNIIAYTDGSSLANPGPSGCGISIEYPLHSNPCELLQRQFPYLLKVDEKMVQTAPPQGRPVLAKRHYTRLTGIPDDEIVDPPKIIPDALRWNVAVTYGGATNNYAELKAIETTLIYLENLHLSNQINLVNKTMFLVSDSDWALKMVTGQFKPKEQYVHLVTAMRAKLQVIELKYNFKINFVWCKGHSDIEGNEFADQLGNAAAAMSKEDMISTQIDPIFEPETSNLTPLFYTTQYHINTIANARSIMNPKMGNELTKYDFFNKKVSNGQEYYSLSTLEPPNPPNINLYPSLTVTSAPYNFPLGPMIPVDVVNKISAPQLPSLKKLVTKKTPNAHSQPLITITPNQPDPPVLQPTLNSNDAVMYQSNFFNEYFTPSKAFLTRALLVRDRNIAQMVSDSDIDKGQSDVSQTKGGNVVKSDDKGQNHGDLINSESASLEHERVKIKEQQSKVVAEEMAGLAALIKQKEAYEAKQKLELSGKTNDITNADSDEGDSTDGENGPVKEADTVVKKPVSKVQLLQQQVLALETTLGALKAQLAVLLEQEKLQNENGAVVIKNEGKKTKTTKAKNVKKSTDDE